MTDDVATALIGVLAGVLTVFSAGENLDRRLGGLLDGLAVYCVLAGAFAVVEARGEACQAAPV